MAFAEPIDWEKHTELRFNIDVNNVGDPPNMNTVPVVVTINDVNDNSPVINPAFYNKGVSFTVDSSMLARYLSIKL